MSRKTPKEQDTTIPNSQPDPSKPPGHERTDDTEFSQRAHSEQLSESVSLAPVPLLRVIKDISFSDDGSCAVTDGSEEEQYDESGNKENEVKTSAALIGDASYHADVRQELKGKR